MAREKNTIPSTLNETVNALNAAIGAYNESLDQYTDLVAKGDFENAAKALKDGHELVLKLKDLHNGLYRFTKAPKVEKTGDVKPAKDAMAKLHAMTAKRFESDASKADEAEPPRGAMAKLHANATKVQEAKAAAAAKPAAKVKVKVKAKAKAK